MRVKFRIRRIGRVGPMFQRVNELYAHLPTANKLSGRKIIGVPNADVRFSTFVSQITSTSGSCAIAQQRKSTDFRSKENDDFFCSDKSFSASAKGAPNVANRFGLGDGYSPFVDYPVCPPNDLDWFEQDSNGSLSLSSAEFSPSREISAYKRANSDFFGDYESSPFERNDSLKYAPKQIFRCL